MDGINGRHSWMPLMDGINGWHLWMAFMDGINGGINGGHELTTLINGCH
jgi:hypothetical protein